MTEEKYSENNKENIDFDELISALLNNDKIFSPKYLTRLSDLSDDEFQLLANSWSNLEINRKKSLLEDLEELAESNSLMFFENIFEFALQDTDPQIRQIGIRSLWESDDKALIPVLLNLLEKDPEEIVQGQAATGLAHFIYLGELGKIAQEIINNIVNKLISLLETKIDQRIQMRALESLGYSSDDRIVEIIENKYDYGDEDWLASAIIAMGRSADERWDPLVIDKLDHANNQIRLEAAKAAGLLEIQEAEFSLINLTNDEDDEVRMAAAWSLSEIGGDDAQKALDLLIDNTDDEEELDLIQSAIENLSYNEELGNFSLFDMSPDNPDD